MMDRFLRQISLDEIGEQGQHRLLRSRVVVVGAGGLGSPILLYLAAAGVGYIAIADFDKVGLTNLNRQILYTERELGNSKVECAAKRIREFNSICRVVEIEERITAENVDRVLEGYDIVIDACDNYTTRLVVGYATKRLGIPYIYGAIDGFEGQVAVFNYGENPISYRQLLPSEEYIKERRTTKSAIGFTAGIVGSVEVSEAVKIICGYGEVLAGRLWIIDTRTMRSEILDLR